MHKYLAYVKYSLGTEFVNGETEFFEDIFNFEADSAAGAYDKLIEWETSEEERKIEHYFIQHIN